MELEANSSYVYIYILSGVVLFIVIILAINFINLSTARTWERAKELGIRKVLGASKIQLSSQFIFESILTCFLAMTFAQLISFLALDQFNLLTGKRLLIGDLLAPQLVSYELLIVLLIGTISGLIPATTLNRIKSVEALKGRVLNQKKGYGKKYALVGIQFAVSAIMIFGSIVILRQVQFLETKGMGFDKEALMVLKLPSNELTRSAETIKTEILNHPSVLQAGGVTNLPGEQFNQNDLYMPGDPSSRVPAQNFGSILMV